VSQPVTSPTTPWGKLIFSDGKEIQLSGERALVGRSDHDIDGINPEVDLSSLEEADTTSRIHATIEHIGSTYTVTDLNSTNSTRINGKRLEPDKATPINDGDKLSFGKVTCTFKKA
jgi:pSer/pThr/pTyr-binding forkhead associated (FHA) protein